MDDKSRDPRYMYRIKPWWQFPSIQQLSKCWFKQIHKKSAGGRWAKPKLLDVILVCAAFPRLCERAQGQGLEDLDHPKLENLFQSQIQSVMTLEESSEERSPLRPLNKDPHLTSLTLARPRPMIHPCVDPPVCEECQKLELSFFDPGCPGCHEILVSPNTKVPEIFAILRQWTPQTQQNLDLLVNEVLQRGAHINDRDGLTDMTLLHYASKSGAAGIGDADLAAEVVSMLLSKGGDPNIRCRWTNMTALHYAAYFDVVPVIKILLKATKGLDCIPDPSNLDSDPDVPRTVLKLKKTLTEADNDANHRPPPNYDLVQSKVTLQALGINIGDKSGTLRYCGPTEFATGIWAGIELDDEAGKNDGSIGGISYFNCSQKQGIFAPISKISKPGSVVKAVSPTKQSQPVNQGNVDVSRVTSKVDSGNWYGIELDRAAGKNDGSVNGVKYFTCQPKHGVFAPLSRIQKLGDKRFSSNESLETISWGTMSERVDKRASSAGVGHHRDGRPRTPVKRPKSGTGESIMRTPGSSSNFKLEVGMSVFCNNELGTVRYIGPTDFGEGIWVGVELRTAKGKNDGSVQGKRYFSCKHDHGLIVRPNKITVRGINGSRLVNEFYGATSNGTNGLNHTDVKDGEK
ncbi:CLIP3-like protein [Mya arenaria]|uniref:CLIP3-like protein n=1 Tax=Mya arenaria TaxID=6604 RepID=A0ABY7FQL6_MYAAR|nr:CLIP3-like protein [Mya arenaria]